MYKKILIDILNNPTYIPKSFEELLIMHPVLMQNSSDIFKFVEELENKNILYFLPDKTYALAKNLVIGVFEQYNKHFGFVRPTKPSLEDLYIHQKNINGAMHGDYVIAKEIYTNYIGDEKTEGCIVYIIDDKPIRLVGTYQSQNTYGFVVPDNHGYPDIFVLGKNSLNAPDRQKVVVEIINRERLNNRQPEGRIVEVLGFKNEKGVDILSIIKKYTVSTVFPDDVLNEVSQLPDAITEEELKEELKHRVDLRNEVIITIDGENTKDFDDAISIQKTDDGCYLLGVHIADVTHYVKEGSPLDKEALKRGTSIYLADRVIPMLPEKLSNRLCSLNPKVDRFALSCTMKINSNGDVIDSKIYESVIKTAERMTYPDVEKLIERSDEELTKQYTYILDKIDLFYELSLILRNKRHKRGSIDFDFPEAIVILDENGKPYDIVTKTSNKATRLIEEFMIVCNETISEFFTKKNIPFLYRIHEKPSVEKIKQFIEFMNIINQPIKEKELTPKNLQRILEQSKDRQEFEQISYIMLRSLSKAKYSDKAKGHFGLANEYYSHFTSPIRRYPDLQIHRIIKEYLHNELTEARIRHYEKILSQVAQQSTEAEIMASQCEAEVTHYKMCEYMLDKIGLGFEGKISGVIEKGVFIVLPNQVEGFIPAHKLDTDDDVYYFEEDLLSFVSYDGKKTYTLGTPIKVKVIDVNMNKREILFSPVHETY